MFEKILITPEATYPSDYNYSTLIDAMLYYQNVYVLIDKNSLSGLMKFFGLEILIILIQQKRLIPIICGQTIHPSSYDGGKSSEIAIYGKSTVSEYALLSEWLYNYCNDRDAARYATSQIEGLLELTSFGEDLLRDIHSELKDDLFVSKSLERFIQDFYPEYLIKEKIEAKADIDDFGLIKITSNLDTACLADIHKVKWGAGVFSYDGYLRSILTAAKDCLLSSNLSSEIATDEALRGQFEIRLDKGYFTRRNSEENQLQFMSIQADGFMSLGEAILSGNVRLQDLPRLLTSEDSDRFRTWLSTLSGGKLLATEFENECREKNSDKPLVKTARVIVTSAIGAIIGSPLGPTGMAAGILGGTVSSMIPSSLDSFIGDRLVNGWSPSLFVNNVLRNKALRQE